MRLRKTWNDKKGGFNFEIVNWGDNSECWNYYIYFTQDNTPQHLWESLLELEPTKYSIRYESSFLGDVPFHIGCTFAEFQRNGMQEIIAVKAGCDYAHYYDEGHEYELEDVTRDCHNTIDALADMFKEITK